MVPLLLVELVLLPGLTVPVGSGPDSVQAVPPLVVPADAPGQSKGFLDGKSVYVSQGHGWTWNDSLGRWATQRVNTHGVVEDFLNAEAVNTYLIPYLMNAGAQVFPTREWDMNSNWVVLDNDGGPDSWGIGTYAEVGSFETSTAAGFGLPGGPIDSGTSLFELGTTRFSWTSPNGTDRAVFVPLVPEGGQYSVSVSYAASPNRTSKAHLVVRHAGGVSHFRIDQKRHGGTWIPIGTFRFEAGTNPESGAVEWWNDAPDESSDTVVSVDAVKFGGGVGVVRRGTGTGVVDGPTSQRPRFEENARYAAQFNGAPESVYDYASTDGSDDVSSRSRYAAWQHVDGEDAVYVSWHTNAPDPGKGTSTWVYGPNEPDGQYIFTGTEGSDVLAEFIHDEVVSDIRAGYDETWVDQGLFSAWFGELNPTHNDEMPATLIEVGFHDTASDCLKMQDPKFRALVARAIYQGVVRYFAWKDGVSPVFVPDAPVAFSVRANGLGSTRLSWEPAAQISGLGGDAPSSYRVYRSADGRAFGDFIDAGSKTELVLDDIPADTPTFFRVTAVNAGGESFPTPVLATLNRSDTTSRALVVLGFDRIDRYLLLKEDLSSYDLDIVSRMFTSRMNRYDYIVEHAQAIAEAGFSIDSVWHDGLPTTLELLDYSFVDWSVGRESHLDEALSSLERSYLGDYLEAGGRLVLTGTEIGWDLVLAGDEDERAWYQAYLGAECLADDGESYKIQLIDGTWLTLDDGSMGTYNAAFPDVVGPTDSSKALAWYNGDQGLPAAIVSLGGPQGRVAYAGFPLEAVQPGWARLALLKALLDELEVFPTGGGSVDSVEVADQGTGEDQDLSSDSASTDLVTSDSSSQDSAQPGDLSGDDGFDEVSDLFRDRDSGWKKADTWIVTQECHTVSSCATSLQAHASQATVLLFLLVVAIMAAIRKVPGSHRPGR